MLDDINQAIEKKGYNSAPMVLNRLFIFTYSVTAHFDKNYF